MKQARYKEPLPLAVIEAARAGDAGAVEQVLQYYNGYINKLCIRTLYDDLVLYIAGWHPSENNIIVLAFQIGIHSFHHPVSKRN